MTKPCNCRLAFFLALMISVGLWVVVPATEISSAGHKESQGKLQFNFISFGEEPNGIGRFTMVMKRRVRCRFLGPTKNRSLKWLFDTDWDGDFDLKGRFECAEGGLLFFLRGTRTHNRYEPIPTKRPTRRSLQVRVPPDLAELRGRKTPSAVAKSRDAQSPGCRHQPCKHRRPPRGGSFP